MTKKKEKKRHHYLFFGKKMAILFYVTIILIFPYFAEDSYPSEKSERYRPSDKYPFVIDPYNKYRLQDKYYFGPDKYSNQFPFNTMNSNTKISSQARGNITEIGAWGYGDCNDSFACNGYLYMGNGRVLEIYDVTNPAIPVKLGSVTLEQTIVNIYVRGNYAYIAIKYGMQVVDVSESLLPQVIGTYYTFYWPFGFQIEGNYAYIAVGPEGLRIVDISNPSSPTEVGHFGPPDSFVNDVAVYGDYCFLRFSKNSNANLKIISTSNKTAPFEVKDIEIENHFSNVVISGHYAYISRDKDSNIIFDISLPETPVIVGTFPNHFNRLYVKGNYLYGMGSGSRFGIYDISNPTSPILIGEYYKDMSGYFRRISVSDGYAYFSAEVNGMIVYDISNPENPFEIKHIDTPNHISKLYVSGSYAYLIGFTDVLRIIDISIPSSPKQVSYLDIPLHPRDVVVKGPYAYVLGDQGLYIIDISNPSFPVTLGFWDTPSSANNIFVEDNYVYVPCLSMGLRIVDVSNPSTPTEVSFLNPQRGNQDVYVSDNYAYIANRDTGLIISDVSNPTSPFVVSSLGLSLCESIFVDDTYAYIASGFEHCKIIDTRNIEVPVAVGTIERVSYQINAKGTSAFIPSRYHGFEIYDVSDPTSPILLDSSSIMYDGLRIHVVDGYAYVGGYTSGFSIFDVSDYWPSISVTSPNGGEKLEEEKTYNITWTSSHFARNVRIKYSMDNGVNWIEIIASTENDGLHPWIVPATLSTQCLIRISNKDGDLSDNSNATFTIFSPSITVTSPNGGEAWEANSSQNITWTSNGTVNNVKIEYSTNNGVNWTDIVTSTENDGTHPWTVPNVESSQCLIRLSDSDGNPSDTSDNAFTIFSPSITVTSPNGGEAWESNSMQNITWTSNGTVGNVKIEYSINNGNNWTEIIANTENNGTLPWTVPDIESNQCLIRVSEIDGNPSDTSDTAFSIFYPSITVTSPNGGENISEGTLHTITWTSEGTIGNVMIDYSINNGNSWINITDFTPNNGSYNWPVPSTPSDNCLVRVREKDGDGGPGDLSDAVFSIVSQISGTITIRSPNGGETWTAGSTQQILWNSIGDINNVTIKYSTNNGTTWNLITKTTENSGSYNWLLPETASDKCLIRVIAIDKDLDSMPSDTSDSVFSIVVPSIPKLTLTAPNGGEQLLVGTSYDITWHSTLSRENVGIEYSVNGGDSWTGIITSIENNGKYNWTIPNEPSDNCLIRISEPGTQLSDVSDAVFSILQPISNDITVTAPNGGETWTAGSIQEITWTSNGGIDNVNIEFSRDNGTTWESIQQSAPNNGSFNWTIPDVVSTKCLVRVTSNDMVSDPIPSDTSDAVFSIESNPTPFIRVTHPNGGEELFVGSHIDITWLSNLSRENIKIEYSSNGGQTWTIITNATENTGNFEWVIPDNVSDACLIRISEVEGNLVDIGDAVFSIIHPTSNEITVISPNGGENWTVNSLQEIKWTSNGDINLVAIEFSTDAGRTWQEIIQSTSNDGSHDWTIPDSVSDDCLVRIKSVDNDLDTQSSDISDQVFSIVPDATGEFRVTLPNGGEEWEVGTTQAITWISSGDNNSVMIEYSGDNGNTWSNIADSANNTGTYDWVIPDTVSSECLIRVSTNNSNDNSNFSDISDALFSIVAPSSPTIRVINPNGSEELQAGSLYEINWYSNISRAYVKIEYSGNGGDTWTAIVDSTANDGDFDWLIPDEPSQTCLIRISDTQSQIVDVSDAVFSIISN